MADAYPKWLYHKTLPPVIVNSPEEHAALGEGWEETPAAFLQDQQEESPRKRPAKFLKEQ